MNGKESQSMSQSMQSQSQSMGRFVCHALQSANGTFCLSRACEYASDRIVSLIQLQRGDGGHAITSGHWEREYNKII